MVREAEIKAKYNEFYQDYSNRNIDDYEVFIRSRVVEHFFHLSHYSIDKLTALVNTVLDREGLDSSKVFQQEGTAMNGEKKGTPLASQNDNTVQAKTALKKLLWVLGPIVAIAGLLAVISYCKK